MPLSFCRYYFSGYSFELAQLVPLPYFWRRYTYYSDRSHDSSVTISRCYKDVYVNSFFFRTARLWNSMPIEWFLLICDLNGFKSGSSKYLSKQIFLCFNLFLLFLVSRDRGYGIDFWWGLQILCLGFLFQRL